MKKNDLIETTGKIIKLLPNANFIVQLDNKHQITAYISGKIRKNHIKILVGDKVTIEFSQHDLTKGRISHRYK